jgi:hypothetical protein
MLASGVALRSQLRTIAIASLDAEDPLDPDLPPVVDLQGTPRLEPTVEDREDNCLEELLVVSVERAVYEDALRRGNFHSREEHSSLAIRQVPLGVLVRVFGNRHRGVYQWARIR